ncbi:gamma-glutamylcyclotransferase [Eubacteriales bacterium OttesenSCG-928-N13]|nr:gamma-glutamylcyclotransferase [Eubacteriales bacterium OttesenSCG-928-N13]
MKYIAYGSNMIAEQMAFRCPNARFIGVGLLPGHQLEFYLHATVERSENNVHVPVAVWEISAEDEHQLDRYEGYPSYYIKEEHTVRMSDGSEIKGMIYRMKHIRKAPPTQSYYKGIADAYNELGLGFEIELVLEPALMRALTREDKP